MAGVVILICPTGQQEYFLPAGLTPILKIRIDLPVAPFCRISGLRLPHAELNEAANCIQANRSSPEGQSILDRIPPSTLTVTNDWQDMHHSASDDEQALRFQIEIRQIHE